MLCMLISFLSVVAVSISDGVGADADVHLCGPLVRHLLPAQVQVHHGTRQDRHSDHMGVGSYFQ